MRLADFEGVWRLERGIEDFRGGTPGRFAGEARFIRDAAGLVYAETGTLVLGGAAPVPASRSYLWREAGGAIELRFAGGGFFHRFDRHAAAPEAEHLCAPDRYRVRYDFARWPLWSAVWRVSGPRKDYAMASAYAPAGQADRDPASTQATPPS